MINCLLVYEHNFEVEVFLFILHENELKQSDSLMEPTLLGVIHDQFYCDGKRKD